MSCAEVREKLPLFVGGDLDSDVLEAVRAHLGPCADCARRAEDAARARRELVAAFRAGEADARRPELWSGIRAALVGEGLVRDPGQVRDSAPAREPASVRELGQRRDSAGRDSAIQATRTRPVRWTRVFLPLAAAAAIVAVVQLGGLLSAPAPGVQPHVPQPSAGIVAQPVSGPVHGGLQNVPPTREDIILRPFLRLQRVNPGSETGVSSAAYNGLK